MENNMEKPNVNNLNGIPNFGYGFGDVTLEEEIPAVETVPTEEVEPSLDEVVEDTDTEVVPKKKKK